MASGSPESEHWALGCLSLGRKLNSRAIPSSSPGSWQGSQRPTSKWHIHLSGKRALKTSKASKRHSKRNCALVISHYRVFQTSGKLRKNYNFQDFLILKLFSVSHMPSVGSCLVFPNSNFCCPFTHFQVVNPFTSLNGTFHFAAPVGQTPNDFAYISLKPGTKTPGS